jgi:hypothetical protein
MINITQEDTQYLIEANPRWQEMIGFNMGQTLSSEGKDSNVLRLFSSTFLELHNLLYTTNHFIENAAFQAVNTQLAELIKAMKNRGYSYVSSPSLNSEKYYTFEPSYISTPKFSFSLIHSFSFLEMQKNTLNQTMQKLQIKYIQYHLHIADENSDNPTLKPKLYSHEAAKKAHALFQFKMGEFLTQANQTVTTDKLNETSIPKLATAITNYFFLNIQVLQLLSTFQEIDIQSEGIQDEINESDTEEDLIVAEFDAIKDISWVNPIMMDLQIALHPVAAVHSEIFNQKIQKIRDKNASTARWLDEANKKNYFESSSSQSTISSTAQPLKAMPNKFDYKEFLITINPRWQEIIEFKLTDSLAPNSKRNSPLRNFSATFFELAESLRANPTFVENSDFRSDAHEVNTKLAKLIAVLKKIGYSHDQQSQKYYKFELYGIGSYIFTTEPPLAGNYQERMLQIEFNELFSELESKYPEYRLAPRNENSDNPTFELQIPYEHTIPQLRKLCQDKLEQFLAQANENAIPKVTPEKLSELARIIKNYYFLNFAVIQALLPHVTYSTIQEKDLHDPNKSTSRNIQVINQQTDAVQNVINRVKNGEDTIIAEFDAIKDIPWIKPIIMDLQAALYPTPDRSQLNNGILPCFNQKLHTIRKNNTDNNIPNGLDEAKLVDVVNAALVEYIGSGRGDKSFAQEKQRLLADKSNYLAFENDIIKEIIQRPHKSDYTVTSLTVVLLKHLLNSQFKNDFFESTTEELKIPEPFSHNQFTQHVLSHLKPDYMLKNKNHFSTFTKRLSQMPAVTERLRRFSNASMSSVNKPVSAGKITTEAWGTANTSTTSTASAAPQPQSSEAHNWIMALTISRELAPTANAQSPAETTFHEKINAINQKVQNVALDNVSENSLLNSVSIFKFDLTMALKNLFKTEGVASSKLVGELLNRFCADQGVSQIFFKPSVNAAMTQHFSKPEDKIAALLEHLQPSYKDVNAQFNLKSEAHKAYNLS